MNRDVLSKGHQTEPRLKRKALGLSTQQAQGMIYNFLLNIVRKQPPAKVLLEFKHLFFDYEISEENKEAIQSLNKLILANNDQEFRHTLKRACYILINNWDTSRNHAYIKELVELFADFQDSTSKRTLSPSLNRLRTWITNFVNSQDYHELKLFLTKHGYSDKTHWSSRYTSYLLVPQYTNCNNPAEQREAAKTLSKKLKDQFKFDLAMYTARSQAPTPQNQPFTNPTALGDEVIRFIKRIVAKSGSFSYENVANIFLKQIQSLKYKSFKSCLQNYLIFSVANKDFVRVFKQKLTEKLEILYEAYHEQDVNEALILRTCNRIIEYLTTEDQKKPSALFVLLLSQGHPLTLVIVLLKIILISPHSRTHLENCIANLIQYYVDYPEDECRWVVNFFEVFNITFAIHADNVQYNLIKMEAKDSDSCSEGTLDTYRVFSQRRESAKVDFLPEEIPMEKTSLNTSTEKLHP